MPSSLADPTNSANYCDQRGYGFNGVVLVVTTRPPGEPIPADYEELLRVPGARKLQLEALSADDVLALACQRLSVSVMPGPVADLIRRKAQGNPFYGEELAFALRDLGFILVEDGRCRIEPGIDLDAVVPPSLGAVIISRVDRRASAH